MTFVYRRVAGRRPRETEEVSRNAVPQQPLALRRPEECQRCGAKGTVRPEQIIKGDSVMFQWECSECHATWAVVRGDDASFAERRVGPDERRRQTRTERRTG
jgi:hypothetical protein